MPIKPENAKRYPKDWKQIRKEVLTRAGHKCEQCGVENHVYRNRVTGAVTSNPMQAEAWEFADGEFCAYIVLTIAHLDHVPENCGEPGNRPNLRAWCQRCHLDYDRRHHMANANSTRRKGKAIAELFQ